MININFPLDNFSQTNKYRPEKFSLYAVILVCFNKFLTSYLLSITFGIPYDKKQSFKYYLSDFERKYLGFVDDLNKEDYFSQYFYSVVYNITSSLLKKRIKGVFEVSVKFVNKDSLENSYYDVNIELLSETGLKIDFSLYSLSFIMGICEDYLTNMWKHIFKELKKYDSKKYKLSDVDKNDLLFYSSPILFDDVDKSLVIDYLNSEKFVVDESIVDTYHVLFSLYNNNLNENNEIFIKADDILKFRLKMQNINSSGNRGGYKLKSKEKIRKNIFFLSCLNLISADEIDDHLFRVVFNKNYLLQKPRTYKISQKVLSYNPKTHSYEKRLGEFLLFVLLNEKESKVTLKLSKLIEIIKDLSPSYSASQIRERFENALDRLVKDKIISGWHYKDLDEDKISLKNWFEYYKSCEILVY